MAASRTATSPINYQERGREFKIGDKVFPFFTDAYHAGTVVAVWPAIGMVDVEYPHGATRQPVEDLQRIGPNDETVQINVQNESVPAGAGTVPVSPGPTEHAVANTRVARAFVKRALYWAAVDRRYKASRSELENGDYRCPKCRQGSLKKAIYKRLDGSSDRLFGCPHCMFLIRRCDILGHPEGGR
jgi:hypothetical protein